MEHRPKHPGALEFFQLFQSGLPISNGSVLCTLYPELWELLPDYLPDCGVENRYRTRITTNNNIQSYDHVWGISDPTKLLDWMERSGVWTESELIELDPVRVMVLADDWKPATIDPSSG